MTLECVLIVWVEKENGRDFFIYSSTTAKGKSVMILNKLVIFLSFFSSVALPESLV